MSLTPVKLNVSWTIWEPSGFTVTEDVRDGKVGVDGAVLDRSEVPTDPVVALATEENPEVFPDVSTALTQ